MRAVILTMIMLLGGMVAYMPSEESAKKHVEGWIKEFNLFPRPAGAAEIISDKEAIRIIARELAQGADYLEVVLIGCTIRNKGTLDKLPERGTINISQEVFDKAMQAWEQSAKKDETAGAKEWGPASLATPKWAKDKFVTGISERYVYYRMK